MRERPEVLLIGVLFVVLGMTYSLVMPVFEASDEIFHYPVVQHIANRGRLPVQQPGVETMWEQEGSQPPLYYLLGAGLTFWIDTGDLETIRWLNPHAKLGVPLDPDNKNMIIHTEAEDFPWRGTVLAVHLIRFLSVALGTASVVLCQALVRAIWPDRRWVAAMAMALAAFNPMFVFIAGSVNNDNLIVLLSTWTLLLLVRVLKEGITMRRAVTLAVVVALATITKISGLTLLPLTGLVLLIHGLRTKEWRQVIGTGVGLAGAWLALSSWWYIRNVVLYGELLGLETHVAVAGGREIGLWALRHEWYGFWVSYWALFGAVNILADGGVYVFYAAISLLAVIGLAAWVVVTVREKAWGNLLIPGLLALQVLIVFVGVVRWTLTTYASQGRLMFPVMGVIGGLMAYGLLSWLPQRWRVGGVVLIGVPMLAVAVAAPFRYIVPTYALPAVVEKLPETATPVGADFEGLELVGVEMESVTVQEGGRVPVTVYWRAARPLDENYSIYLHALGRDVVEIGKIDSYPGAGALPTSRMQPGEIVRDSYSIELDPAFEAPTVVRVLIGVATWDEDGRYNTLTAVAASGVEMGSVIVEAGVAYPVEAEACGSAIPEEAVHRATFGELADLWVEQPAPRHRPGDTIPVALYWDHRSSTPTSLTVFVHLVSAEGKIGAQADGPPLNGDYPTTLWRIACRVKDVHRLQLPADLPAGEYRILVGLYDANDPAYARVPAFDADGSPYPDQAVPVGTITVEGP